MNPHPTPAPPAAASPDMPSAVYLEPVRRHIKLVVLIVLLAAAAGVAAATRLPTRYTASASILVSPISADPTEAVVAGTGTVDLETEIRLATSRAVADVAAAEMAGTQLGSTNVILRGVSATSGKSERVLDIHFEAEDPDVAARGAEAVSDAYIAYRSSLAATQIETARDSLQTRIDELEFVVADLTSQLAEIGEDSPGYAVVEIEQQLALSELASQQQAFATLSTVLADPGEVIDPPTAPSAPSSLGAKPLVAGSVAGGIVAALALAYLLDAISAGRRVRQAGAPAAPAPAPAPVATQPATAPPAPAEPAPVPAGRPAPPPTDIAPTAGIAPPTDIAPTAPIVPGPQSTTVAAGVSPAPRATNPPPPPVSPAADVPAGTSPAPVAPTPGAPVLTTVDEVADQVAQRCSGRPVTVTVIDLGESSGSASTALTIARRLGTAGHRAVVIDADVIEPRVHVRAGSDLVPGLAETLGGKVPASEALRSLAPGVNLLTAGVVAHDTVPALMGDALRFLLSEQRAQHNAVLLVAGTARSDTAHRLAAVSDALVLVVDGASDLDADRIQAWGDQVIGVVAGASSDALLPAPAAGFTPATELPRPEELFDTTRSLRTNRP